MSVRWLALALAVVDVMAEMGCLVVVVVAAVDAAVVAAG